MKVVIIWLALNADFLFVGSAEQDIQQIIINHTIALVVQENNLWNFNHSKGNATRNMEEL